MSRKTRIICLFSLLCVLLSLCGCSTNNHAGVYRYYSLAVTSSATGSDSDATFGVLGDVLGKKLVDAFLEDSYLEIKADGSTYVYSPSGGFKESGPSELLGVVDNNSQYEFDGDLLHVSIDGIILTYKKATAEEVSIYNQIVKAVQSNGTIQSMRESDSDSSEVQGSDNELLEDSNYLDTIPLGDYYCVYYEENGTIQEDGLEMFLCFTSENQGYRYSTGYTFEFHYSYTDGVLKITPAYGESVSGTYQDGVITLQTPIGVQKYDKKFIAPVFPVTDWTAIACIDPDTEEPIDLPRDDFALRMSFKPSGKGTFYYTNEDGTKFMGFEWEQRGNAILVTDNDGDKFEGIYHQGYLRGVYLGLQFVFDTN